MTNVVGKTTLQIGVDGTQAEAGVDGVKQAVRELNTEVGKTSKSTSESFKVIGAAADDTGNRIGRSGQRVLTSLENQANRATLTAAEYARLRAEQAGVATAAAPFIARIDAASRGTAQLGMSAKATAAAMRGVPAQLTDIVVGLQGGQAPLTVLLQQGGQLKDMFGGVVPAAKALASSLLGLVNPYTVAAAAAAAFGYAIFSGSSESREFDKSLAQSGNAIGTTSAQLTRMASAIGEVTGSRGKAVDALNQIAGSGKLVGTNVSDIATAAVEMNKAVGKELGETVREFVSLGEKPADALAKLNEKYNFLTPAVYDQVKALEKQGRTQEAVALAQDTLASAFQKQANLVNQNLGTIEKAWRSVTGAASSAWEAMKGIGREETVDDLQVRLKAASDRLRTLQSAGGFADNGGGAAFGGARGSSAAAQKQLADERTKLSAEIQQMQQQGVAAFIKGEQAKTNAAKIEAKQRNEALDKEVESNAKKRAREIEQVKRDAELTGATAEQTAGRIKAIEDKYKDSKGSTTRDSAAATMLLQLKEQEASLRAQIDSEKKATDAVKDRAKFEQQIADLKGKSILTADQKSLLANQDAIRTQLDKNVAVAAELKSKEALVKLEERSEQIQNSIASSQESRAEQYDRSLGAMGMGRQAQERIGAESSIRREYQKYQDQLNKASQNGTIGGDTFVAEQAKISQQMQSALDQQRNYYSEIDRLQGDWALGFKSAFADYVDESKNAFRQAGQFFSSMSGSFTDSIVRFAATGKFSVRDFANTFIQEMIRISVQTAATKGLGLLNTVAGFFAGAAAPSAPTSGLGLQAVGNSGSLTAGSGLGLSSGGFSFGGYRANGGGVKPGSFYEVNENGPELYKEGGRTWLMAGDKEGYVAPALRSGAAGSSGPAAPQFVLESHGVDMQVIQERENRFRLIAKQEADSVSRSNINKLTPRLMASQQYDGNSRFSKAQSRATKTQRNRG